ncbi:hypothetical protein RRG08_058479 [Elysia crispata]|uniref:Uncharacterized protein n=1 Tax=Elysia crispata TaxID=231223 RepID=A0AAE0Y774_9GAST|nr:hypothetical protein RRG08_058479 [Elysia crispata]
MRLEPSLKSSADRNIRDLPHGKTVTVLSYRTGLQRDRGIAILSYKTGLQRDRGLVFRETVVSPYCPTGLVFRETVVSRYCPTGLTFRETVVSPYCLTELVFRETVVYAQPPWSNAGLIRAADKEEIIGRWMDECFEGDRAIHKMEWDWCPRRCWYSRELRSRTSRANLAQSFSFNQFEDVIGKSFESLNGYHRIAHTHPLLASIHAPPS